MIPFILNCSEKDKVMASELYPAFERNNVALVFNCNNAFVPYMSVMFSSIIANASAVNNYDIVVLHQDIARKNQQILQSQFAKLQNFSLRFYNMKSYIKKYKMTKWSIRNLEMSTYFRVFIFAIFKKFSKVLYLDSDMVTTVDVAEMFNQSFDGNLCVAVRDLFLADDWSPDSNFYDNNLDAAKKLLQIDSWRDYFNAGMALFDVKHFNLQSKLSRMFEVARKNALFFHDQDILNSVLYHNVKLIDKGWNYQVHNNNKSVQHKYDLSFAQVKIIHFTGAGKPWKMIGGLFADVWWQYARKSPFYQKMFKQYCYEAELSEIKIADKVSLRQYLAARLLYRFYKISALLTWGDQKEYFKNKKRVLKYQLRLMKQALKSC